MHGGGVANFLMGSAPKHPLWNATLTHIARHATTGSFFQHDELRPRRLLLHKREIQKLEARIEQGTELISEASSRSIESRFLLYFPSWKCIFFLEN